MCLCVYPSLMPFLEFFSFCLVLLSYSNVLIFVYFTVFFKEFEMQIQQYILCSKNDTRPMSLASEI